MTLIVECEKTVTEQQTRYHQNEISEPEKQLRAVSEKIKNIN